jgi:hypothetical protein
MVVFEVISDDHIKTFLEVPSSLHSDLPNWTIQLGVDVEVIFNPKKNSLLGKGKAKRWVLLNDYNHPLGRIAAFYNFESNVGKGGIGFFECDHNQANADLLFQTAHEWLKQAGCKTVTGPINFGEKDRYWGLLAHGFERPTVYLDTYNPDYYVSLFVNNGYSEKDKILTHSFLLEDLPVEKVEKVAERLLGRGEFKFMPFDFDQLDQQSQDLCEIYKNGFDESTRMKHLTPEDIKELILLHRNALDEKAFWMAYHYDKPIAVSLFMKDMNQKIRNIGSSRKDERINLKGVAFAVVPGYRSRGVEIGLSYLLFKELMQQPAKYRIIFCGINEKSTQVTSLFNKIGTTLEKIHKTFEKQL